MSEDHLQFLKENFIIDYEEAIEEFHEELPLRPYFQEIIEILNQKRINSSTPIRMKRPLYGLKFALAECVILTEKKREKREKEMKHKVENKRSLPSISDAYNFVKNHWLLFKTWRILLSIKKQLLQDMRANADDSVANQNSVRVYQPWDYQFFLEKKIYGFNDHLQKIEAFLLDDGFVNSYGIKTLGIIGMGGSGKTALAKKVFCSTRVQESFYPMIWVELPLSLIPLQSIVTIVCECLSSCEMNNHDNDLGILLRKMHNCLLNTKYLIVLNGVWHASDWCLDLNSNSNLQMEGTDHFQRGLPKDSGGAIIITSRFQDVATKIVGEQNLYHLEPTLDKDSCWSLILESLPKSAYHDSYWSLILDSLPKIAYHDPYWPLTLDSMHKILNQAYCWSPSIADLMSKFVLHPTLVKMKDEMVDKCDGLPLAAKALAEIVGNELMKQCGTVSRSSITRRITRNKITRNKIKVFWLRINKSCQIQISKVLEYLRTYKGVIDACFPFDQNNYEEVVVKAGIFFDTSKLVADLSRFSWEAEIVSSIKIYYNALFYGLELVEYVKLPCGLWTISSINMYSDLRGGVIISPPTFNQLLDMNPLSPTLLTYCFVLFLFLNPNATKVFCLRVRSSDCFIGVLQDLKAHPDVSEVLVLEEIKIRVETNYNPLEIMKDLRKRYEIEIINLDVRANYRQEMKLWGLPKMIQKEINSQINNSPPSPSPSPFISCILKLFQDPAVIKRFCLRFDKDDYTFSLEILKKIWVYPGVSDAFIHPDNIKEIEGVGKCNLLKVMRDLNELVKTEIISFLKIS